MYEVLLELDDLLETLTYWLSLDGVFCDGCNHCLGWEYGAHVIGYFKYCPYCGDRLEDGTEEET